MSETKFTKGPWKAFTTSEKGMLNVNCGDVEGSPHVVEYHPSVATIHNNRHYQHTRDNASHNANLIAAAPELYDALEDLLEKLDMTPELNLDSWGVYTFEAEAALAKARGEHETP